MATVYRRPGVLEITRGWDFTYKLSQYHDSMTLVLSLVYFTFYISLPARGLYDYDDWGRSWGIYWFELSVNFRDGRIQERVATC